MYDYLKEFGFGDKTGIDLPGEMGGLCGARVNAGTAILASISMGQEIGVTPLQMVTAVSAIANGAC